MLGPRNTVCQDGINLRVGTQDFATQRLERHRIDSEKGSEHRFLKIKSRQRKNICYCAEEKQDYGTNEYADAQIILRRCKHQPDAR